MGQASCGNLLLKGEGVEKNATAAVHMYELAAAQDNIRALNGARARARAGGEGVVAWGWGARGRCVGEQSVR